MAREPGRGRVTKAWAAELRERLCTRCGGVIHRVDIGPDMLGRPVPRWVRIDQRPIGCPAVDRKAYCTPAKEKR